LRTRGLRPWGLWYPSDADPQVPTPVIEIGEILEPNAFTVMAASV
jgi:hypothetical protein